MGISSRLMIWGQASGANPGSGPSTLTLLALRRWCSGLTLCSPEAVPSLFGLWWWLLGLGMLLLLAVVFQGPGLALRQVFDIVGHARLLSAAYERLRRAGRMVATTIGAVVIAWTVSQGFRFNDPHGKDDLLVLTKARSLGELALEQGILAALTPLRDLFALGDNVVLLCLATGVLFRVMTLRSSAGWVAERAGRTDEAPTAARWASLLCAAASIYLFYRMGVRVAGSADLPTGFCLIIEAPVVPFLMAVCDGVMVAWILVELRNVSLGDTEGDRLDPVAVVGLVPGSVMACLWTLPARYLAAAVLLVLSFLPAARGESVVESLFRWQLNWGLTEVQGAALTTLGLAGVVAWGRGKPSDAVRGYFGLLAAEGGHLVVLVALAGLAAGAGAALAYLVVLSLPSSTWVLGAADAYAHYATLPAGLLLLSALVELGERVIPKARFGAGTGNKVLAAHDAPGE